MRLFGLGGGNTEDEATRERREGSQQSLEAGGLPFNAMDRLREQAARQGTPGHLFTSDLSVNELALTQQTGYDPLGQVMGSSIYHVGWQWLPQWSGASGELEVLTAAYYQARHLAIGRLQQEAALLGATGVIGVRLERKSYEWGAGMLEFAAIGTAIRERDTPPMQSPPFISDLSGSEFWMLRQAGYRPVGFAMGNCTYYQVGTMTTQYAMTGGVFGGGWQNQELADFTQAMYRARELAMSRMEQEALAVGAVGVVGADIEADAQPRPVGSDNNRRYDIICHFTAIGTAIAPREGRWPDVAVLNIIPLK